MTWMPWELQQGEGAPLCRSLGRPAGRRAVVSLTRGCAGIVRRASLPASPANGSAPKQAGSSMFALPAHGQVRGLGPRRSCAQVWQRTARSVGSSSPNCAHMRAKFVGVPLSATPQPTAGSPATRTCGWPAGRQRRGAAAAAAAWCACAPRGPRLGGGGWSSAASRSAYKGCADGTGGCGAVGARVGARPARRRICGLPPARCAG